MTAHASIATPITLRQPRRSRRRIPPRLAARAVTLSVVAALATVGGERLAAASHAACTLGTPAGTSCAEALVLLGYP
jgi:hypothetical protein